MSYNRFISYLYRYDNGIKGNNTGFLKLEIRDVKLKLSLGFKDDKQILDIPCQIYMCLIDGDGQVKAFNIGTEYIHTGSVTYKYETDMGNVFGSGYGFDRCFGLAVYCNDKLLYVTKWKDDISEADIGKLHKSGDPEGETGKSQLQTRNDEVQEKQPPFDIEPDRIKSEQPIKEFLPDEIKNEQPIKESLPDEIKNEQPIDNPKTNKAEEQLFVDSKLEKEQPKISKPQREAQDNQEVAATNIISEDNKDTKDRVGILKTMFATYPKLPIVANNQIYDPVRIRPSDIGLMKMDNWRLGINSFLTHGYYSYKYLMLGKIEFQDKQIKVVIGVPGVYSGKEKYLAEMFGFDTFVPVRQTNTKVGQFGYWIIEVVE